MPPSCRYLPPSSPQAYVHFMSLLPKCRDCFKPSMMRRRMLAANINDRQYARSPTLVRGQRYSEATSFATEGLEDRTKAGEDSKDPLKGYFLKNNRRIALPMLAKNTHTSAPSAWEGIRPKTFLPLLLRGVNFELFFSRVNTFGPISSVYYLVEWTETFPRGCSMSRRASVVALDFQARSCGQQRPNN